MRKASGDLFPTDAPLPAGQLIGRDEDVREIATALENGTHLIVAGPRRTGKTSVCEAALTRLGGRGVYTATLDLFRIATTAELAEAIAVAVIANRGPMRRLLRKARNAGLAALSATQANAVLKMTGELGEGVELALTPGLAARDPDRALDLALALPERIAVADGKRAVLFMDEFQEVASPRAPYGDPDAVTKRMRAVFQRSTAVSYLFAGSVEHLMRDLFAPSRRAFSGFGSFHSLRPISAAEWEAGLKRRFAGDDCDVREPALTKLIEMGGGHPRATMRISQQSHLASVQLETREIDLNVVELGYRAALRGDTPMMEQTVDRMRTLHKSALPVARALATGASSPRNMHPGVRDRVLKLLRDAGIVEHRARGEWLIVNPLLKAYLADLDPVR
ncbi:MAG TPA: ATP-binding protein [Thermoleophilaceae bacterium]|nr:ATP-binding protein [Thermoleophilaceae bacterium]